MISADKSTDFGTPQNADSGQASQSGRDIDAGIVEVGLAVAALAALFTNAETYYGLRIFSGFICLLSANAAGNLFIEYMLSKVPEVIRSQLVKRPLGLSVPVLWFDLIGRNAYTPEERKTLGLLSLYVSFFGLLIILTVWALLSLFAGSKLTPTP